MPSLRSLWRLRQYNPRLRLQNCLPLLSLGGSDTLKIEIENRLVSHFALGGKSPTPSYSTMNAAVLEDSSDIVITPRDPATVYNFGPASLRDSVLYTSERPGGDPDSEDAKIPTSTVEAWMDFMKEQGIQNVLVLLDDNELDVYEPPGLLRLYKDAGFELYRTVMGEKGASDRAVSIIRSVASRNEKVVAHCTHGMGRSGRVAAGWIASEYGLSPTDATDEALAVARANGMERMGASQKLQEWLENT